MTKSGNESLKLHLGFFENCVSRSQCMMMSSSESGIFLCDADCTPKCTGHFAVEKRKLELKSSVCHFSSVELLQRITGIWDKDRGNIGEPAAVDELLRVVYINARGSLHSLCQTGSYPLIVNTLSHFERNGHLQQGTVRRTGRRGRSRQYVIGCFRFGVRFDP